MDVSTAQSLISNENFRFLKPESWADLGCGNGTFTNALNNLLYPGSIVYAIDKKPVQFTTLPAQENEIRFIKANFEKDPLDLLNLDGILMANSLHFVTDKERLLMQLQKHFGRQIRFIIVEYDTMQSNNWVPFPIDFIHLEALCRKINGFRLERIGETKSIFGNKNIYAALIYTD